MGRGTLKECRDAVYDLLGNIRAYEKRWKTEPNSVTTRCEVAVLIGDGTHSQFGTQMRAVKPRLRIRSYMPLGAYPQGTEDTIIDLWDAQVALFNSNVCLSGTAKWSKLERYRLGYEKVAGVKCRIMESTLRVLIAEVTEYAA